MVHQGHSIVAFHSASIFFAFFFSFFKAAAALRVVKEKTSVKREEGGEQ